MSLNEDVGLCWSFVYVKLGLVIGRASQTPQRKAYRWELWDGRSRLRFEHLQEYMSEALAGRSGLFFPNCYHDRSTMEAALTLAKMYYQIPTTARN